jgi:hypothetical protein
MATGAQATNEIYRVIRQAILDKDVVVATYHGYVREMCPHILGTKNGRLQCLMYQFGGGSSSALEADGSPANWRCIIVEELLNVSIKKSTGQWHTASNYSRPQTCVNPDERLVEFVDVALVCSNKST